MTLARDLKAGDTLQNGDTVVGLDTYVRIYLDNGERLFLESSEQIELRG